MKCLCLTSSSGGGVATDNLVDATGGCGGDGAIEAVAVIVVVVVVVIRVAVGGFIVLEDEIRGALEEKKRTSWFLMVLVLVFCSCFIFATVVSKFAAPLLLVAGVFGGILPVDWMQSIQSRLVWWSYEVN